MDRRETKVYYDPDTKEVVKVEEVLVEKDAMSDDEFANKMMSLLFGTYKDAAREFKKYLLEQEKKSVKENK